MATVAAVIASTHHPFYYQASTATGAARLSHWSLPYPDSPPDRAPPSRM
jgi:hypothetical protein